MTDLSGCGPPATYKAAKPFLDAALAKISSVSDVIQAHSYYADDYRDQVDWLFTQPEVLLLLERLRAKPYRLLHAVQGTDLEDVVRATAISAGTPLPAE